MLLILLTSRRFFPLFLRQFFSVFADNFVKNFLVLLLLKTAPTTSAALISLAGAAFIASSFLTSALGGECADKYDKARLIYFLSLIDVAIALLAAIGIVLSNIFCLFIALIFLVLQALSLDLPNMASFLIISHMKNCQQPMLWWKAQHFLLF